MVQHRDNIFEPEGTAGSPHRVVRGTKAAAAPASRYRSPTIIDSNLTVQLACPRYGLGTRRFRMLAGKQGGRGC